MISLRLWKARPGYRPHAGQVTSLDTAYRNYVLGSEAWYNRNAIDAWKMQTDMSGLLTPAWTWYRSNWRILHIDGFEPGFGNRLIHFDFKLSAMTRDSECEWPNLIKDQQ